MTPLEAVRHLVGMQAQVPHNPYTALWSRLEGFRPESLSELLERREVVRIGVMRGTIHLVTADDCLLLRPLTQPIFEAQLRRHREHGPALRSVDLDPVVEFARPLLEEQPRSGTELRALFAERFPELDPAALAHACSARLAFVQVPPRGLWGRSAQVRSTTAESWLGRPFDADPSIDAVVLRYLAAFGPASVADVTTWCRLTGLREVVERLRPPPRHLPGRARPRALRPPGCTAPGPGHARAGALPAGVRQRRCSRTTTGAGSSCPRIARRWPAPGRSGTAPCWPTGSSAPSGGSSRRPRRQPRPRSAEAGARLDRGGGPQAGAVPRSGDAGRAPRRAQPVSPAPLRVSASAPRSEAKTSASGTSIPLARA